MPLDYIKEIARGSWTSAVEGGALIELILTLLVLALPVFFRPKAAPTEQSIRKILVWKFLSDDKWRLAMVVLGLLFFHLFVIAPYHVYTKSQRAVPELQVQITTLSNGVAMASEKAKILREIHRSEEFNDLAASGQFAFTQGRYPLSVYLFGLSFEMEQAKTATHNQRALNWPLYACAMLKTNQPIGQGTNRTYPDEALAQFRKSLTDMRDTIADAVEGRTMDLSFSHTNNLDTITKFTRSIIARVPPSETNLVVEVLATVEALAKRQ